MKPESVPTTNELFPTFAGKYEATIVPCAMNAQNAVRHLEEAGLTPYLELAPQTVTPAGTQPVLCMFGRQLQVRSDSLGTDIGDYLEVVICIPFIRWKPGIHNYHGNLVYAPLLYLHVREIAQLSPIFLGWIAGYRKVPAQLELTGHERAEVTLVLNALARAEFKPIGAFRDPSTLPLWSTVRQVLDQPLIGRSILFGDDQLLCTRLKFDFGQAQVRPAAADINMSLFGGTNLFCRGLPEMLHVNGIDQQQWGVFQMKAPWTLQVKTDCSSILPE